MEIHLAICSNKNCSNYDIEYRLVDQPGIVECGGCGDFLEATATNEQVLDFPNLATSEEIVAEQDRIDAARKSALEKLSALGLTEDEARVIVGL